MSEPNKCCPVLSNASVPPNLTGDVPSFRNVGPSTSTMNPAPSGPPALPPRPDMSMMQNYGMNSYNSYGGMGSYGMGGMGGMGGGYGGGYGYGGYSGGYGMGGMGMGMSPYGYNRPMYGDIESRFIQIAEENSRPTFDSIQSLVHAVGSVAMMLENTFFALTSSFRAILGVAENFGRLRSLFAQFWSTFAVVRSLNWLIRKLSVMLGIRTESEFKAWAEAVAATQPPTDPNSPPPPRGASWPALLFLGVVAAAPYIVLKMLNGISSSIHEKLHDPTTWQHPLRAVAQHDYTAASPQEISFTKDQVITLAPQQLQGNLWNSGWLMGSTDRQTAGLLPVTYIKVIKPAEEVKKEVNQMVSDVDLDKVYNQEL